MKNIVHIVKSLCRFQKAKSVIVFWIKQRIYFRACFFPPPLLIYIFNTLYIVILRSTSFHKNFSFPISITTVINLITLRFFSLPPSEKKAMGWKKYIKKISHVFDWKHAVQISFSYKIESYFYYIYGGMRVTMEITPPHPL